MVDTSRRWAVAPGGHRFADAAPGAGMFGAVGAVFGHDLGGTR